MTLPVDLDTIHNPSAGGVPPRSWFQGVRGNFAAMLGLPIVELVRTNKSILNATNTTIDFPVTPGIDSDNLHDPVTNNDRITAATAGWYFVNAVSTPVATTSGEWDMTLRLNGVDLFTVDQKAVAGSSLRYGLNICRMVQMAVGDYLNVVVSQTSGATSTVSMRFGAWWVAPAAPSALFTYADLDTVQQLKFRAMAGHLLGDQIRTNFQSLVNRPICVLAKSSNQSIPNYTTAATAITWDIEQSDAFGMHAGSAGIATILRGGNWLLLSNLIFASNAVGERSTYIVEEPPLDGLTIINSDKPAAGTTGLVAVTVGRLEVGAQMQAYASQTSGGALNVLNTGAQFALVWLGE